MNNESEFLLAHISDLHFSKGTDKSNKNHTHSINHLIGLQSRLTVLNGLDRLIVSGDVSNHGDRQSLITASGWLFNEIPIGNGEYTGLKMKPQSVCVVPGNHDAWNAKETGTLLDRRQKSLENYNFAFPEHEIHDCGCYFDWIQKGSDALYMAFVDSCFLGDTEENKDSTFGTLRFDQAIAKGKWISKSLTQIAEIIGSWFKSKQQIADNSDIAERVFSLLKSGLDTPDELGRKVKQFSYDMGEMGASTLDLKELKAIQKRISVGLNLQERKELRKVANSISSMSKHLKVRPFLQIMSGSSAKVLGRSEKKRSFNVYRIQRKQGEWKFVCERYTWEDGAFSENPAVRNHTFQRMFTPAKTHKYRIQG